MLNTTFPQILEDIMSTWDLVSPRWLPCREKISFHFKIDNPYILACDFEWRNFPWKYLAAELIWYLSWDLNTFHISHYAKLWWSISDSDQQVSSNYWHIVLHKKLWTWKTQYDTAKNSLISDRFTRQSLIRYNAHEHAYEGNKDFPCTISNQFFIRNNKLHIIVNMRSNDMFFGFQYDVAWFWLLLQSMALDLQIEPGNIYWHTGSAHVYESMFEKANTIIASKWVASSYSLWLKESFIQLRNKIVADSSWYWLELEKHAGNERYFIEHYLGIEISDYAK